MFITKMDKPFTVKNTAVGRNRNLYVAATSMQGWRHRMEDAYSAFLEAPGDKGCGYFAVFDGHHGSVISEYARKHLHHHILAQKAYQAGNIQEAIEKGFLALDSTMKRNAVLRSSGAGSTAVIILIKGLDIYCGNIGDAKAVAFVRSAANVLSTEHFPSLPPEQSRIRAAGCFVINNKIDGRLNVSRAFGDFMFKSNVALPPSEQAVISIPDVQHLKIMREWKFIVLGSDGVFNSFNSEAICSFIDTRIQYNYKPEDILEELLDLCLLSGQPGSKDNMSIILIILLSNATEKYVEVLMNGQSMNQKTLQKSNSAIKPSTSGQ